MENLTQEQHATSHKQQQRSNNPQVENTAHFFSFLFGEQNYLMSGFTIRTGCLSFNPPPSPNRVNFKQFGSSEASIPIPLSGHCKGNEVHKVPCPWRGTLSQNSAENIFMLVCGNVKRTWGTSSEDTTGDREERKEQGRYRSCGCVTWDTNSIGLGFHVQLLTAKAEIPEKHRTYTGRFFFWKWSDG